MNDIVFTKAQGGLARQLPGEDHISGILFYHDTLPSGFTATTRVKEVADITAAVALGIVDDKSDETKATGGNVEITTPGAAGTIATIVMDGVTLGSYTVVTGDANNDVATGLRAAINALTGTHGYVAAGTGANVLLTPPTGLGDSINGGSLIVFSSTGTGAATVTQFSGGVDAFFDVMHYHISEFFRCNPGATLWIGIYDVPSTWDFEEVKTMQRATSGKLRQVAVYLGAETFDTAHITALHAIAEDLDPEHMPLSILYAADLSAVTDLTTLSDLRLLDAEKVSAVIGQDGGATGAALYAEKGYSITCLGACLGAVSKASVHECIGWVAKFNLALSELDVAAFANGDLFTAVAPSLLSSINGKGYIFLVKQVGVTGTWFNDSHASVTASSDYAYIENSRTIDKAIRNVRVYMIGQLNGPVYVDPTSGRLAPETVTSLEQMGQRALEEMERAGELSGYAVRIDPTQNLLQNSNLQITIGQVPVGVSRTISISIGFVTSI